MNQVVLSATGLYNPPESISNEELVISFNAYVDRYNAAHADEIAAGQKAPLSHSQNHERIYDVSAHRQFSKKLCPARAPSNLSRM